MKRGLGPEGRLQKAIIELAEHMQYRVYHVTRVDGKLRSRTSVGFPDLVLVGRGRVLYRELKVGSNRPTEAQEAWLAALSEAGQDAKVWRERDWHDGTVERELA